MEFERVIETRTATRKFKADRISEENIQKILRAATLAPTAKNQQPQRIYVIESDEALAKVNQVCPCIYGAPVAMLVCADKDAAWHTPEYSSKEMDASIVATHMILEATNLGIDSCWVKYFDPRAMAKELDLSENIAPICIIPMGYKADDYAGNPAHTDRKPIAEISFRL